MHWHYFCALNEHKLMSSVRYSYIIWTDKHFHWPTHIHQLLMLCWSFHYPHSCIQQIFIGFYLWVIHSQNDVWTIIYSIKRNQPGEDLVRESSNTKHKDPKEELNLIYSRNRKKVSLRECWRRCELGHIMCNLRSYGKDFWVGKKDIGMFWVGKWCDHNLTF